MCRLKHKENNNAYLFVRVWNIVFYLTDKNRMRELQNRVLREM
jgi:hypothetical protein